MFRTVVSRSFLKHISFQRAKRERIIIMAMLSCVFFDFAPVFSCKILNTSSSNADVVISRIDFAMIKYLWPLLLLVLETKSKQQNVTL